MIERGLFPETIQAVLKRLRDAGAKAAEFVTEEALRNVADEVESSVAEFDPSLGLASGVRRMVAALANAQRVYAETTGKVLVETPPVAESGAEKLKKLMKKTPPWGAPPTEPTAA